MTKTIALVLNVFPYSESSLVIKALSWELGLISILAKGIRRKNDALTRFGEYEFQLYTPKEEGLYLLKDYSLVRDFSQYPSPQSWAAADCGLELFSRILFPLSDAREYYTLATEYLKYLQKTKNNGILIFWRMLARLYRMMGIPLSLDSCAHCAKEGMQRAFTAAGELLCKECKDQVKYDRAISLLSPNAAKILQLLPEIGMHLDEITLTQDDISQINQLFLSHYYAMQKQNLNLKSLGVLCQFYP